MSRSALENVRAHLRFVSRIGQSHARVDVRMTDRTDAVRVRARRLREHFHERETRVGRGCNDIVIRSRNHVARHLQRGDHVARTRVFGRHDEQHFGEHEHVEVEGLDIAVHDGQLRAAQRVDRRPVEVGHEQRPR